MLDLQQHLLRQMAFSRGTFGPGERREGVSDHIRKELVEVEAASTPSMRHREWTDVAILALDGLTRSLRAEGYGPNDAARKACELIADKQSANEMRNWPDWRTMDPKKAIEHVRNFLPGEAEVSTDARRSSGAQSAAQPQSGDSVRTD